MVERTLITIIALLAGFVAFCLYRHFNLRRATASAIYDPLLKALNPHVPTIVYFTTPQCIPCQTRQQPALARLEQDLDGGLQIVKIDAIQDPDAAERWGVRSVPTTFVLDHQGRPKKVNYGVAEAEKLKQQIRAVHLPAPA